VERGDEEAACYAHALVDVVVLPEAAVGHWRVFLGKSDDQPWGYIEKILVIVGL
jgi:hypothetical protein